MNWFKKRDNLKLTAIVFWLVFTVAFALWWYKFSIQNISLLAQLEPEQIEHWRRQERMVFWEGGSWLILLVLGGAALIALVLQERRHSRQIKEFFASFSHEIKTSLASLRLQGEALQDELVGVKSPVLDRLIGDTVRLQLQLENSLFLSSQDTLQLYVQPLSLSEMIERMREQWPGLKIALDQDCLLRADERALRTIFSNLLQNAIVHGGASEVSIATKPVDAHRVLVSVRDNGKGFEGVKTELGELFHRPRATSGSGLGLYICRLLLKKMNGDLTLPAGGSGFHVDLRLEGARA